jgi:hypothetical protein
MSNLIADPAVRATCGVLVLCVLIAAAFYLLASFRDYTAEDREETEDVLAKFREMHRKGDISEEEFRTIQATTHPKSHGATSQVDFASPTEKSDSH